MSRWCCCCCRRWALSSVGLVGRENACCWRYIYSAWTFALCRASSPFFFFFCFQVVVFLLRFVVHDHRFAMLFYLNFEWLLRQAIWLGKQIGIDRFFWIDKMKIISKLLWLNQSLKFNTSSKERKEKDWRWNLFCWWLWLYHSNLIA